MLGPWVTTEPIVTSGQIISTLALGAYNFATQAAQLMITSATIVYGTAAPQFVSPVAGFRYLCNN